MIVTEYSIRDIIDMIPNIQINDSLSLKPKFHWGDEDELNRYIQLKKEDSYPLIWLLPSTDKYEGSRNQYVNKTCSFVIATREIRKELFNDERYIRTFDRVLNPLSAFLIKGLTDSNITDRIGTEFDLFKHPNYSAESESNGTIDIWDAVKLDIEIKFKDNLNCLKAINYG
tara:strand:+ start:6057 stop:6569 length:513 start_codon:yes stop_codon:yes gene_type:complete